ncbi:TetR/AcrR family transcriptional regulator [Cystobacter fuscus]|uniref:TetR/AcrR family transcriptional regulator n=1 Tax=Cystobacter fuscus TaxID=43 RepID=UPI002B27E0EF|nr:TetR/AcrR family transcriptional regulator [Cystobacter fuscus]
MNQKTEQKQKSREAILASAAALLRERGIKASSVMDVMKGAGLTVGGFYGHFESKEHLFTETIQSAASTMWNRLLGSAKGDSPRERVLSVVERYLSRQHRDHPDMGCVMPSVAPEVAREGEPYRGALEKELSHYVRSLADLMGSEGEHRQQALGLIALMYGALSLSRAVSGTPLSDELLRAARKFSERALGPAQP